MIVTVTLNPAVDKLAYVHSLRLEEVNRLTHVESDAGGKGINVSRTLALLEVPSIATGFLGGSSGNYIYSLLQREYIQCHMIEIIGNTRTNLKVIDEEKHFMQFNEEGPFILQKEMDELMDYLRLCLDGSSILVISGSMPRGCSRSTYTNMIEIAKENDALVFLNTTMNHTMDAIDAKPDIIKISNHDLERIFHLDHELNEEEIIFYGKKFIQDKSNMLIVSRDNQGIYLITQPKTYHCEPMDLEIISSVGANDAFVAGFIAGLQEGYKDSELLKLAGACYAATTQSTKSCAYSRKQIESYLEQVSIRVIE